MMSMSLFRSWKANRSCLMIFGGGSYLSVDTIRLMGELVNG